MKILRSNGIIDQADKILAATLISKTQKQNKQSTERNRAECCSNTSEFTEYTEYTEFYSSNPPDVRTTV